MTAPAEMPTVDLNAEYVALAEKLGIPVAPHPSVGWIDAMADRAMERLTELRQDLARYDEAEKAAIEIIRRRYATIRAGTEADRAAIERSVLVLAEQAAFPRGKKSRTTPFGRYGRKDLPARLTITDPKELVEWARLSDRTCGMIETKEIVPHYAVVDHFKATGEVPYGVERAPAQEDVPYFTLVDA